MVDEDNSLSRNDSQHILVCRNDSNKHNISIDHQSSGIMITPKYISHMKQNHLRVSATKQSEANRLSATKQSEEHLVLSEHQRSEAFPSTKEFNNHDPFNLIDSVKIEIKEKGSSSVVPTSCMQKSTETSNLPMNINENEFDLMID